MIRLSRPLTPTGAGPEGPSRPLRLRSCVTGRGGAGSALRGRRLRREDGLHQLRRKDAVGVDQRLEDDAGGGIRDRAIGQGLLRDRIEEVVRRAQDQADGAVQLGVLDELDLLGIDRQDDDLLQTFIEVGRAVGVVPSVVPSSVVPSAWAGGGGSSVPSTCMPWMSTLTLSVLMPLTIVGVSSAGFSVMTGKLL